MSKTSDKHKAVVLPSRLDKLEQSSNHEYGTAADGFPAKLIRLPQQRHGFCRSCAELENLSYTDESTHLK